MNYRLKINKQRRICDLILAVMLILMYFMLGAVHVSPVIFRYQKNYQEIDWTLFQPRSPNSQFKNEISPQTFHNENTISKTESILKQNLDFLEKVDHSELNIKTKKYDPLRIKSTEGIKHEMDVVVTNDMNQLPEFDITKNPLQFLNKKFLSTDNLVGPGIEIEDNQNLNLDLYANNKLNGLDQFSDIQDDKLIPDSDVIKLELRTDEIKEEDKEVAKFLHELIRWMRAHQMPLPQVVKKVMNYEVDDLTSKVKFEIGDKSYELFLLCKENILEIKICLVEKDALIMLIDSGFKEKSNYLRRGAIKRNSDGTISLIWTRQEAPSDESTKEFYQIFLSWWEKVKSE